MLSTGQSFVDRKTRNEIKKEVLARLMPSMEPTLTGIHFLYDPRAKLIYVNATSDNQLDAFRANFLSTLGIDLIAVDPSTAAIARKEVNVRDWEPVSFSPEVPDEELESTPGTDFMTWLWYRSEACGGMTKHAEYGEFGFAVEGPLLLERVASGAQETALRKGLPSISTEAKAALLGGKKLRRAKITLARGDEIWSFGFDAHAFVFRGVKLPEPKEMLDPVARFQDRVLKLDMLREVVLSAYDQFIAERGNSAGWEETKHAMHEWVSDRAAKK